MRATFGGTTDYAGSTSTILAALNVAQADTATSVHVAPSSQPFTAGGAGTFDLTAEVTNTDATDMVAEGSVTFTIEDASNHVIDVVPNVPVTHGQALFSYSLPAGTPVASYTVEAAYSGSSNYGASVSAISASLSVGPASTSTSIRVVPTSQPFAASAPARST